MDEDTDTSARAQPIFNDWNTEQYEVFEMLGHRWDVRAAKRILARGEHPTRGFDPAVCRSLVVPRDTFGIGVGINYAIVDDVDLGAEVPVIIATLDSTHLPIDGWHRIARALEDGVDELPCVVLDRDQTRAVTL